MTAIFDEHVFTLQWHVTADCQQRCAHCYIYDEDTYQGEKTNALNTADCLSVIDNFAFFCESMKVGGRISFTGGDPLLRGDLPELIERAKLRDIFVGILGNPHLLNVETAEMLKGAGVESYQLSLDGLETTHDSLRQKGSFSKTINAVSFLKKAGISVGVMMTLSKMNIHEVLPLMELVGNIGVDAFAFARISAVGAGRQYKDKPIDPLEYRNFLLQVEQHASDLKNRGIKTRFRKKCHLWKLLDFERGRISLSEDKETIYGGCTIGVTGLIVLADGTVMACRRFPSIVGKVPQESFFKIFIESPEMNSYRDYDKMEKCSRCELLQICRGCPAVAYGQHGRWTAPDPQCWKEL